MDIFYKKELLQVTLKDKLQFIEQSNKITQPQRVEKSALSFAQRR